MTSEPGKLDAFLDGLRQDSRQSSEVLQMRCENSSPQLVVVDADLSHVHQI
jgi:hypothetical protein